MITNIWSPIEIKQILKATPSLQARAWLKGNLVLSCDVGETKPIYDLASLTKPMFGWTAVTQILKDDPKFLKRSVQSILAGFPNKKISIEDLLLHRSGLKDWRPIYKKLRGKPFATSLERGESWCWLGGQINKNKSFWQSGACPKKVSTYSDIGYLVLAICIQEIFKESLEDIWAELKIPASFGSQYGLHFCAANTPKFDRNLYAPTEKSLWRKKVMQGEVHDDNTWALGGVSTHAGLFGSIDDLGAWCLELRKSFVLNEDSYFGESKQIKNLCSRKMPVGKGDWSLGFMLPSKDNASCGKYFSPKSIGHLGFTGTSFWIDPTKDLIVVLLSNRVHPSRRNRKFVALRAPLHERIYETIILT